MATILIKDSAYKWIFGKLNREQITKIALSQNPAEEMAAYTVERNYKDCLNSEAPFTHPDMPDLDDDDGLAETAIVQASLF